MIDWQKRLACRPTHANKNGGTWHKGLHDNYGLVIASSGAAQVKIRCGECGEQYATLPYAVWRQWQARGAQLVWGQVNAPTDYPPCTYSGCPAEITEYHHFAPYNTFGADADSWPVMPLCREHHHQWHRTMDGYQWHRRGIWRDTA